MFRRINKPNEDRKKWKASKDFDPNVPQPNLQYDLFRKQFIPTTTSDRSNQYRTSNDDDDDNDPVVDSTINMFSHDPLRNPVQVYDEYQNIEVTPMTPKPKLVKKEKSFLKSFLSFSFKSSQKIHVHDEDTPKKPEPVIFQNATVDHSSTKLKTLVLDDKDLKIIQETDEMLELYQNFNRIRKIEIESAPEVEIEKSDEALEDNIEQQLSRNEDNSSPSIMRSPVHGRKRLPIIEWSPETLGPLTYGDPLLEQHYTLTAKNHKGKVLNGQCFYDPAPGTILDSGTQKLSVTFIPLETNFGSVTEERYIEVLKRKPKLTWNYTGGNIIFLTPLPSSIYDCITCELAGGSYEYSHPVGTILELGVHQLYVKFYPSPADAKNFTFGYAHINVEVSGVIIPITWKFPVENQFNEENIETDEKKIKQAILRREFGTVGKPGYPLYYGDHLPEWMFCAKCLITDEITKLPVEIEGRYEYSHHPGMLLPAGFHTISVTFYPNNREKYHHSSASRKIFIYRNTLTLSWKKAYSLIDGEALDETVMNCTVSPEIPGEFIYTPPIGTVLPIGTHPLSVLFIPAPPANYLPESCSNEMRIRPKKQLRINWFPPEEIIYLTPLSYEQLNASLFGYGANSKGKFVYTPDFGAILPVGEHVLSVEFISENVIFENVTSTVTIKVKQCLSKLLWPPPNSIYEGENLAENIFNCECTNTQGTFHYSVQKGEVLKHGTHTLTCNFIPYDSHNFIGAKISVQLLVRERPKFQPKLVWKHMYEDKLLEYGFSLNSQVLNAKCLNFPGDFSYKPQLDTVLPVGQHELVAYFTPEEKHKCLAGTIKNSIEIIKRVPTLVWYPNVKVNEKTKAYELRYGQPFHRENYLTAYAVMSDTDNTRIFGDFIYTAKKRNIFLKKITFNPKKKKSVLLTSLSKNNFLKEEAANANEKMKKRLSFAATAMGGMKKASSLRGNSGKLDTTEEPAKEEKSDDEDDDDEERAGGGAAVGDILLDCGEHVLKCVFVPSDAHNFESIQGELTVFITRQQPDLMWKLAAEFPTFVYPFSLTALPRPYVLDKTIKGRFEFVVTSEEVEVKTIHEEVDDNEGEDEEGTGGEESPSKGANANDNPRDKTQEKKSVDQTEGKDDSKENNEEKKQSNDEKPVEAAVVESPPPPADLSLFSKKKRKTKIITRYEEKQVTKHKKIKIDDVIDSGTHVVEAVFYPENINNFLCNTATVSFKIIKAVPVIVWEPITSVTFGTILTKYQHGNAYCTNITNPITGGQPGEFIYDPPMGTIITIALADKYNNINELIEIMKKIEEENAKLSEAATANKKTADTDKANSSAATAAGGGGGHHADMKIQNNANNRIIIESITENFNASQHNKNYLKITLKMKFIPYNIQNYEIVEMEKELIIERKSANILWSVPYRIPYGSILDKNVFNARLSDQDLANIEFFYKINNKNNKKNTNKANNNNNNLLLGNDGTATKQDKESNPKGIIIPTGNISSKKKIPINPEENVSIPSFYELFSLEFDPPINFLLNFTQKEFPIKTTFRPLQNLIYFYNETIKILYLDIYPIPPNIIWRPKCTSLQEGNPLDPKVHCNAYVERSSLFPGTLQYSPSIGTSLTPGHYNILCEYLPKIPENELPIKVEKHFEIVRKPPRIIVIKDEFTGKITIKRVYEGAGDDPKNKRRSNRNNNSSPSPPSSPKRRSPSPPLSPGKIPSDQITLSGEEKKDS